MSFTLYQIYWSSFVLVQLNYLFSLLLASINHQMSASTEKKWWQGDKMPRKLALGHQNLWLHNWNTFTLFTKHSTTATFWWFLRTAWSQSVGSQVNLTFLFSFFFCHSTSMFSVNCSVEIILHYDILGCFNFFDQGVTKSFDNIYPSC